MSDRALSCWVGSETECLAEGRVWESMVEEREGGAVTWRQTPWEWTCDLQRHVERERERTNINTWKEGKRPKSNIFL